MSDVSWLRRCFGMRRASSVVKKLAVTITGTFVFTSALLIFIRSELASWLLLKYIDTTSSQMMETAESQQSFTRIEGRTQLPNFILNASAASILASNNNLDQTKLIHYIWCGNRFMDFRHYIAMKSTIQAVRPDRVVFHYNRMPMHDPDGYFTWFEVLLQTFHNIMLLHVSETSQRECRANGAKRFLFVMDIMKKYGGMYVPEEAVFLRVPPRHVTKSFSSGVGSCTRHFFSEGIVMAKKDNFSLPETEEALLKMISHCHGSEDDLMPCMSDKRFSETIEAQPSCVRLETTLFPKRVWDSYDRLANLTKLVAYGKTDVRPKRSILTADQIPRIAHYLCTEDSVLTFGMYVSILSALYVGDLHSAVVHGPKAPSGIWWERLQQDGNVLYLHREVPLTTAHLPQQLETYLVRRYIMRTQILLQYGGVFHDDHVFWTQRLPDEMIEYEVVVSPDWHNHGNWPESLNHALLIARQNASYLQQLLKVYQRNGDSTPPWFADHYLSYRLVEMDPTLVHIEPRLQVKCWNHNCHPTWLPDYRSQFMQNRPGHDFDWRHDTLSVHWAQSATELDVDSIKSTPGLIADIVRNVLDAASISMESL